MPSISWSAMALTFAVGALGNLLGAAVTGTPLVWDVTITQCLYYVLGMVLSLLAMYVITNIAAGNHFARTTGPQAVVLPIIGVGVAGYVIYRNIWPVPPSPFNVFPYIVAGWLVVAALAAVAVPAVVRLRSMSAASVRTWFDASVEASISEAWTLRVLARME